MNYTRTGLKRLFLIGGFSILGGFAGAGVASVIVGIGIGRASKTLSGELMPGVVPLLAAGGVLGFIAGLIFSRFLFRHRPASAQAEVERKYIGNSGTMAVYAGFPMLFYVLIMALCYEALTHRVGDGAAPYVAVLVLMVVAGLGLYCFGRLPRSLVMPVGLLGWVLLFAIACWYGWFGPDAFGHH